MDDNRKICKHKSLTHYHDVGENDLIYWITECKDCGKIIDRHIAGWFEKPDDTIQKTLEKISSGIDELLTRV